MSKSGRDPRQSIKAVADSDWLKEAEPSTLANWWGVGGVVRQLGTKRRLMKLLVLPRRSMRGRANDTYILQSSGRPCVATDMTPHYATTPIPLCALGIPVEYAIGGGGGKKRRHPLCLPARDPIRLAHQLTQCKPQYISMKLQK